MAVLRQHIPYFQEILALQGFLKDPMLIFGFQECEYRRSFYREAYHHAILILKLALKGKGLGGITRRYIRSIPPKFVASHFLDVLRNYGATDMTVLDLHDPRAHIHHDMNAPIPSEQANRFNTVIDIGSLEHVFDTRQCFQNLFKMVSIGGHLMLHGPCKGYYDHGLHTLSPECWIQAVELNGFTMQYLKYSDPDGIELQSPDFATSSLIWMVAQKNQAMPEFVCPQQGRWSRRYSSGIKPDHRVRP